MMLLQKTTSMALFFLSAFLVVEDSQSFGIVSMTSCRRAFLAAAPPPSSIVARMSTNTEDDAAKSKEAAPEIINAQVEEVEEMVQADEWIAFTIELSKALKETIFEDLEEMKNVVTIEVEAVSKELDTVIKQEVANWRAKAKSELYEIGDLVKAIDEEVAAIVERATGKTIAELEASKEFVVKMGDLYQDIDVKTKNAAAAFCGKDTYEFGDITVEIDRRSKETVAKFTGKPNWQPGDVAKEIENRRIAWMKKEQSLAAQAAENYLVEIKDFYSSIFK